MRPHQLAACGVARTFQNIRLFGNLSVEDNVRIALHARREAGVLDALFRTGRFYRDEERLLARAHELLALFRIDGKAKELARNLPYGEQRKLEIARALACDPQLLLLDEPAAGMNPQETKELMDSSPRALGFLASILHFEHDMKLVRGSATVIVLDTAGRSRGPAGRNTRGPRRHQGLSGRGGDDRCLR
jgi:branched-chain amino acid transport system ATP-binding protein